MKYPGAGNEMNNEKSAWLVMKYPRARYEMDMKYARQKNEMPLAGNETCIIQLA